MFWLKQKFQTRNTRHLFRNWSLKLVISSNKECSRWLKIAIAPIGWVGNIFNLIG